ncbi:MAG: helix-turn-helix transcriptional regulator [Eubacteriales bacterium]|nr:helix-turn-helix transcriptional regulator [Eubacteriales bacterium]
MQKYRRIRDLREDKDMSQAALAAELGLTQRTYSRYENADSMMPLDILIKIADYHNVSVDYLLERTDSLKRYPRKRKEREREY